MTKEIREKLLSLEDKGYKDFQCKLMPTVECERVIGVKVPLLRSYAKEICRAENIDEFLADLPHRYYEEDNLHGFLIEKIKSYDDCVRELNRFLPYVDNWATCDTMRPRCLGKNKEALLSEIKKWLGSGHTYTVRYAIGMLMTHFLSEDFDGQYMEWVAEAECDEYYVNMMVAWYFATALAYRYEDAVKYLTENRLSKWVHNKTVQKAIESYRIDAETKDFLKKLRRK